MTDFFSTVQPALVTFWHIDVRDWGGPEYRFVDKNPYNTPDASFSFVQMGGETWNYLPIRGANFMMGSNDKPQRPTLTCPDFRGAINAQLSQNGNVCGCEITRYQMTIEQIDPDFLIWLRRDRYILNSKSFSGGQLDLELARRSDFKKTLVPSRTMMRDRFPGLGSSLRQ